MQVTSHSDVAPVCSCPNDEESGLRPWRGKGRRRFSRMAVVLVAYAAVLLMISGHRWAAGGSGTQVKVEDGLKVRHRREVTVGGEEQNLALYSSGE